MWAAKNGDAEAMVNIIIRNARAELELRILSADRSTEIKDRSCKNLEKKIRSLRNENSMLKSKSKMVTQVALIGIAVMAVTQVLTVVVLG